MIYNYKNRVEISITKEKLRQMAKELQMLKEELSTLIKKTLTSTFESTIKELDEWIDKNVPLMPESDDYILIEDLPSRDIEKPPNQQLTLNQKQLEVLDEIINSIEVEFVENSKPIIPKNILRNHMKMGIKSCSIKDGRFYRIRLGFQLDPELYRPLNENKNLPSYQFMERMINFSCSRTKYHLKANYNKYFPENEIRTYLKNAIEVVCKKD